MHRLKSSTEYTDTHKYTLHTHTYATKQTVQAWISIYRIISKHTNAHICIHTIMWSRNWKHTPAVSSRDAADARAEQTLTPAVTTARLHSLEWSAHTLNLGALAPATVWLSFHPPLSHLIAPTLIITRFLSSLINTERIRGICCCAPDTETETLSKWRFKSC